MEEIPLTKLCFVLKQFIKIDRYKWYCRILKEYAMKGFTVYGTPAPIFVARRMAYAQEFDGFGMSEMKELLIPLCNTAYLLNRQSPGLANMKEHKPKYNTTFTNGTCKDFLKNEFQMGRKIGAHFNSIDTLRALQKDCWFLEDRVRQRTSKLDTFLRNNGCEEENVPVGLQKKYNDLKKKLTEVSDRYKSVLVRFQDKMEDEKYWREDILKKVESIKEKLTEKIREGLTEAYADLVEASCQVKEQDGYYLVKRQLEEVRLDEMVEKIYNVTSATYTTVIPEEFLQATGSNEKLGKIKYRRCDYELLGMDNNKYFKWHKNDDKHQIYQAEQDRKENCFFPKTGGIYVNPVTRSTQESLGIMKIKPGYSVKLKLSLMNGTVGFGWSRKSLIHGKSWGFFFLSSRNSSEVKANKVEIEMEDTLLKPEEVEDSVEPMMDNIPTEWRINEEVNAESWAEKMILEAGHVDYF